MSNRPLSIETFASRTESSSPTATSVINAKTVRVKKYIGPSKSSEKGFEHRRRWHWTETKETCRDATSRRKSALRNVLRVHYS